MTTASSVAAHSGGFAYRTLLPLLLAAGWAATAHMWPGNAVAYAGLNLLACISCAFLVFLLRGHWTRHLHLWVMLFVFIVGYFVKIWILLYFLSTGDDERLRGLLGAQYVAVSSDLILLETLRLAVLAFVAFCIASGVAATVWPGRPIVLGAATGTSGSTRLGEPGAPVGRRLQFLLAGALALSAAVMVVQAAFGTTTPQTAVSLPFRLAGILQLLRSTVLPMVVLLAVYLADLYGKRGLANVAAVCFVVQGIASVLLTTSKIPLVFAVGGLTALWAVCGTFSTWRQSLLVACLFGAIVVNSAIGGARQLRADGEVGAAGALVQAVSGSFGDQSSSSVLATSILNFLVRINGSDTLLNIVSYQPPVDMQYTWWMISMSGMDVNSLYGDFVLNASELFQTTAFSVSLVGFFYFLTGSTLITCFGVALYVLLWHAMFRALGGLRLVAGPVALVLMCVVVAQFTSEGSLQSLPVAIGQFAGAVVAVEFLARLVSAAQRP